MKYDNLNHIDTWYKDILYGEYGFDMSSQPDMTVVQQLFYLPTTGTYFCSTKEEIVKAVNEVESRIDNFGFASFNDFLKALGLDNTVMGACRGWTLKEFTLPLRYEFLPSVTDDGKDCTTFIFSDSLVGLI